MPLRNLSIYQSSLNSLSITLSNAKAICYKICQEAVINAESISEAALIFTVCLHLVHTLQLHFKCGFRATFLVPLQQNFEVAVVFSSFFLFLFSFSWKPLKDKFLNSDIPGMILQLIFSGWMEELLWLLSHLKRSKFVPGD